MGPSPVREIQARLHEEKGTNYSTTVKMLSIMQEKGLGTRDERAQPHIYRTVLTRAQAGKRMLGQLIDKVYGGSAMSLLLQAMATARASKQDLAEIRRLLDQLEGKVP